MPEPTEAQVRAGADALAAYNIPANATAADAAFYTEAARRVLQVAGTDLADRIRAVLDANVPRREYDISALRRDLCAVLDDGGDHA